MNNQELIEKIKRECDDKEYHASALTLVALAKKTIGDPFRNWLIAKEIAKNSEKLNEKGNLEFNPVIDARIRACLNNITGPIFNSREKFINLAVFIVVYIIPILIPVFSTIVKSSISDSRTLFFALFFYNYSLILSIQNIKYVLVLNGALIMILFATMPVAGVTIPNSNYYVKMSYIFNYENQELFYISSFTVLMFALSIIYRYTSYKNNRYEWK